MSAETSIEWTDFSWSPWWGCTKVSPGCAHCYAAAWARWTRGIVYAKGEPRVRTKDWRSPVKWNREAGRGNFRVCTVCGRRELRKWDASLPPGGLACCSNKECVSLPESDSNPVRPRVFPSMMDWLDDEVPIEMLADFLDLVRTTPHLDWLLLTKRPGNFEARMDALNELIVESIPTDSYDMEFDLWSGSWRAGEKAPANVWIGTTVEDQERADERIPQLLSIPAKVRFLSCEPLLSALRIDRIRRGGDVWRPLENIGGFGGVDWVIAGGESGPKARPMHPDWARGLRDQCANAGVPFFFKQWGEWSPIDQPHKQDDVEPPAKNERWMNRNGGQGFHGDEVWRMRRVGKKSAGRLLDGVEHSGFPNIGGSSKSRDERPEASPTLEGPAR